MAAMRLSAIEVASHEVGQIQVEVGLAIPTNEGVDVDRGGNPLRDGVGRLTSS